MLKLLPVALHIRLNDDGAAAKALRAVDRKKLNSTPMAVAFHQLCEAILDSHKSQEQRLDHPLAEPISWFEQNCSVKFEEGQPETLSGDWTARSLLGRFYRDRLPSRQ